MRLTLRTLLAYLDNTLDEKDAQILRDKVAESGFATQLIQRIRDSLANETITAPSPDSVHPIAEANVISEYLDSTLSNEQVAELERVCLEMEPHLAEAAACHQILTMVLGEPAEISDDLRQKMYLLPDQDTPGANENISSIDLATNNSDPAQSPGAAATTTEMPAAKPIPPVSTGDSGVSDAPARLRESQNVGDGSGLGPGSAIAGSKPKDRLGVSDVYDGNVRTSRIMPWLVSLALAAGLLFALAKVFWEPVVGRKTADSDERVSIDPRLPDSGSDPEPGNPNDDGTLESSNTNSPENDPAGVDNDSGNRTDDASSPPPATTTNESETSSTESPLTDNVPGEPETDVSPDVAAPDDAAANVSKEPVIVSTPSIPVSSDGSNEPTDSGANQASDDVAMPSKPAAGQTPAEDAGGTAETPVDPTKDPAGTDILAEEARQVVANLVGEPTLLLVQVPPSNGWVRVGKGTPISTDLQLVNAPGFRSTMESRLGTKLTLVGAGRVTWQPADDAITMNLAFGNGILQSKQAGDVANLLVAGKNLKAKFSAPDEQLGYELSFLRNPGLDPMQPENRMISMRIFSINGEIDLEVDSQTRALKTGDGFTMTGSTLSEPVALDAIPDWVSLPDNDSIEAQARSGLIELLGNDPNVLLSLREATDFRRVEICALAAQTLLTTGKAQVFFGGDGMLNNPKQQLYWSQHFQALRSMVNLSTESADRIRMSISEMQAAELEPLTKLLTGFSNPQLEAGGDKQLVEWLNSESLAVRVLALENLREITGTTLFYRPQENAKRREKALRKWETQLRKGEIRRTAADKK